MGARTAVIESSAECAASGFDKDMENGLFLIVLSRANPTLSANLRQTSSLMRPLPARLLLASTSIAAIAAGFVTSRFIFFGVALVAAMLLVTTLLTSRRPLTRALEGFRNEAVEIQFWGAAPTGLPSGSLVVTSVNALGAGVHVFFDAPGGVRMHLKVAQPKDPAIAPGSVTIGSARYVQWNGKTQRGGPGAPAVVIALATYVTP